MRWIAYSILTVLLIAFGCDRSYKVALKPVHKTRQVQIEPLAQLSANLLTHVVADRQTNLYWSQETVGKSAGQDVMFVMGGADLPRATDLTSRKVLALLDEASGSSSNAKASGNIQSLVLGPDGLIYFYFTGNSGKEVRAALGTFDPFTGAVRVLADSATLMSATRMDRSIALARGQLIVTGRLVRLFIRHTDTWLLLNFDPRKYAIDQQLAQKDRPPSLVRTIASITAKDKDGRAVPIDLTAEGTNLFAGPEADSESDSAPKFILTDDRIGAMYLVNEAGEATPLASLVGLPKVRSSPLIDTTSPQEKRIVFCVAESERLDPLNADRPDPAKVQAAFPAILSASVKDGEYLAIGRENFHAPGEFAIYAIQLQQLVQIGPDASAGYDRSSGQMLRIRLTD